LTLDGWEGPLHLLLDLARRQKVDLSAAYRSSRWWISTSTSSNARARSGWSWRLTIWSWRRGWRWLKSLAAAAARPRNSAQPRGNRRCACNCSLQRLSAMREAGARLMARDRLGRDVFVRGAPEGWRTDREVRWECDLFALIQAYGTIKQRTRARGPYGALSRR